RKPPAGRIPPGMPPKKPLPPSLKPPLRKPLTPQAKPPQGKAAEAKKPKPQFKKAESRESRAIFSRLSKIAEEAQKGRAKKKISSLSLTDKESSERVRKLKKELNIK
ncbi:hypothetical protein KY358_01225, partial [Candidatus Woesearchaeota archaeon]|nr:hypothetical protein [Candidatus Woesearchaeota archaeon]